MKTLKITKDRIIINGAHFFHDEIDTVALSVKEGKTTLFILADDYGHEYEVNDFLEEVLNYINDFNRKDFSSYKAKATRFSVEVEGPHRRVKVFDGTDVVAEKSFWMISDAGESFINFISSLNLQDYL